MATSDAQLVIMRIPLTILSSLLALCQLPVWANANETPQAEERSRLSASKMSTGPLSDNAQSMLQILHLQPLIDRATDARKRRDTAVPGSLDALSARQDLLEARQELGQLLLKSNLEVDYVIAAIDGEENRYTEQISEMMSRRDKAVWYTTILSQWSNGILWSASSSFTLGSVQNPRLSYTDGILGILAGALPTVLSLYAMHQTHGEKRDALVAPNMLSPIFDRTSTEEFFPRSVISYMNGASDNQSGSVSRKQVLVDRWYKNGYLNSGKNSAQLVGTLTATESRKRALTIALLQNRQQMLEDLRTQAMQMKHSLLELMKLADPLYGA